MISWSVTLVGVIGAVVWGYGDLIFKMITDPALNECHILGFHTSKFVWIQPMAGS